jgi:polyisoprenoid-binding protein YceI
MLRPATATAIAAAAAAALGVARPAAAAEEWTIDRSHAHILFFVNHFGMSDIQGEFLDFDGTLMLDTEAPETSSIEVTIDVSSLDSGWAARDEHFLSADFFDAEQYPTITFTSTDVEITGEDTALVTGDLTIKDTTRPATLEVTLNGLADDHPIREGTQRYAGFTATTTVLRRDFGVDRYAPAVSDEVEIRIELEATGPAS